MRQIGTLPTEAQARLFADYLLLHGIAAEVERVREGNAWSIWVVEEDQVDESRALFSRYLSMPDAEEFQQARERARERRRAEADGGRTEPHPVNRPLADSGGVRRGGVTITLLLLCMAVAMITRLGEDQAILHWLLISGSEPEGGALFFWKSLDEVAAGQIWRLWSPVFLHFSLWHLLINLLWLQDLGGVLERAIGSGRFAGLIIWVALVSNLAQYAAGSAFFGGMSGAIYGLLGYLWVRGKRDFDFHVVLSPLTVTFLLVFLALGFFGVLGPTANAAHLSGLLAGAASGAWAAHRNRPGRFSRRA